MRILRFELRKLVQAPMFWIFIALSIAFNAFYINANLMMQHRRHFNTLSREVAISGEYTDPEIGNIFEYYRGEIFAENIINAMELTGIAEWLMRAKYERLDLVAAEFAEQNVSYYIYAGGEWGRDTVDLHLFLFRDIMRMVFAQVIIFAALALLYLLGHERQNKTESVVYHTKVGRKIMRHKYAAGLLFGAVGFAMITGGTLATFFSLWDFSGFWRANVSSGNHYIVDFVSGTRPFITWQSFTVAEFLTATLILGFFLTMVFTGIAGVIGLLFRNTYLAASIFGLSLFTTFFLFVLFQNIGASTLFIIFIFSPVMLWFGSFQWFTDMGNMGIVPWHETWTIVFNLVLLAISTAIAGRRFSRKDMV